jgi:selenocysteine lyase/cysteine desulfurase
MEFGTPNMVGIAALSAGQDWIEKEGVENIYARELRLAGKLVEGFHHIDGVKTYCCESMGNHLSTVTMNIEGMDADDVGIMLDVDHNIAVRTGLHCAPLVHQQIGTVEIHGGVRFSIGAFNNEEHIDCALAAVAEIAEIARQKTLRSLA